MARQITPATDRSVRDIRTAIDDLKGALAYLKRAGARKAADKVRSAIKSAEGAERHAAHRYNRTQEATDA